jgi:hypothetical protein
VDVRHGAAAAEKMVGQRATTKAAAPRPQASTDFGQGACSSLLFLALLGALAASAGGARVAVGAIRVTFWGALAMGLTAGVGALFGTIV